MLGQWELMTKKTTYKRLYACFLLICKCKTTDCTPGGQLLSIHMHFGMHTTTANKKGTNSWDAENPDPRALQTQPRVIIKLPCRSSVLRIPLEHPLCKVKKQSFILTLWKWCEIREVVFLRGDQMGKFESF